jgi:sugar lactone lactonase YvrE
MFDPLDPVSAGPRTAPLLYVDPDSWRLQPVIGHVSISNGLGWSPDACVMYHADTEKKAVFAFDFDPASASLTNQRTLAIIPSPEGGPDVGMVDAEGFYWAAIFGGGRLVRLDPEGKIEREVHLPTKYPTMCAFGGEDLQTAFVTSSSKLIRSSGKPLAKTDGGIFSFRAPAPGLPTSLASEKYFRAKVS